MPNPTKPMTAADELRPYLNADPRPEHVGCGVVAQLLVEHDEQRDRAEEAEAELAEVRAWMADPFNRVRITPVVKRAYRQRDEAVEAAAAAVEEYMADMKAAHAELAELRAQVARLDDCLTATAAAKGSSRYVGQGRLVTLLNVDDVREMISEWRKGGDDNA